MTPEQKRILEAGSKENNMGNTSVLYLPPEAIQSMLDQAQIEIDRYKQALEYVYHARTLSACKNLAGKVLQK